MRSLSLSANSRSSQRMVPLVLMPLLSQRLPLPCMQLGCDDGCFLPEEPDTTANELGSIAFAPEELSVLSLPASPDPSLSHTDVVEAICRGLQFPHLPVKQSGVMRLHEFATYECRVSL